MSGWSIISQLPSISYAINLNRFKQAVRNLFMQKSPSTESISGSPAEGKVHKSMQTSELIFKYINIVIILILLFCIRGFLQFREQSIQQHYYVFATDSLIWCAVGFFGIFVLKYGFYHFMDRRIETMIHPKYTGSERQYKLYSVKKLSLDSIFYLGCTAFAYWLFRREYWFPSIVGGCGECGLLYKDYPDWPVGSARSNMEMYFNLQLGVHVFSVFEMIVIKRNKERKFYEYLLHHFVAASLILFSMMSNQTAAGLMILIVHDASDILLAGGRALLDMKWATSTMKVLALVGCLAVWIHMRILVFPFCLLANVYANKPTPHDEWYMISFEYNYLLFMAFVLYGMHIFWTYMMIKVGIKAASGKSITNVHQEQSKPE